MDGGFTGSWHACLTEISGIRNWVRNWVDDSNGEYSMEKVTVKIRKD